jgi:predicted CoA-binding protein
MDYCDILKQVKTIAVLGISDREERDSGRIAKFLQSKNYQVVGVHPILKEVFSIPVYKNLDDIDHAIDLVDVFIGGDRLPQVLPGLLKLKPKYVWLQLGIFNQAVVDELQHAGINVIYDACIAIEYGRCQFNKASV